MPSGLLHDVNVRYYLPLDDMTEYTQGLTWDNASAQFAPSILTSGIQPVDTFFRIDHLRSPNYTSLVSATGFTISIWTSGYFADDAKDKFAQIGFGAGATDVADGMWLRKGVGTTDFSIYVEIHNISRQHIWTPAPSNDTGWHLVVMDARYETSGWRARVSLDGGGWVDLGVDDNSDVPLDYSSARMYFQKQNPSEVVLDEVVVWGDNDLFTNQELSNLYELYNTHAKTMNQYVDTFGTVVTDSIDCFTHGQDQTSGSISLYIPGQKETKSIDLFTEGYLPVSGNFDLYMSGSPTVATGSVDLFLKVATPASSGFDTFIHGKQIFVDNIDQYVEGHQTTSGNFDLYVSGVPFETSSIDLYVKGPTPASGNFDDIITGHETSSGNISLFIRNFTDFAAFIAVVDQNPSNTVDLFIHGIGSGASPSLYINNSIPLFVFNDGSSVEIQSTWPGFVAVASGLPVASSGTWNSFLRGGNTANDNIDLYINSHASGEVPRGVTVSGSFTAFIEGKSLQDGDEGLLSNGYFAKSFQVSSFAKVHLGVSGTANLYVSGTTAIIPPSATLDLFVFGISGIVSGSHTLYILGDELITGSHDLFVLGIQGIVSGSIPLFVQVTTLGSLNTEFDLYTHGF